MRSILNFNDEKCLFCTRAVNFGKVTAQGKSEPFPKESLRLLKENFLIFVENTAQGKSFLPW